MPYAPQGVKGLDDGDDDDEMTVTPSLILVYKTHKVMTKNKINE
jgi:hypothetical protein